MASPNRTLVKLIIGHTVKMLQKETVDGHRFKWKLFVKGINGSKLDNTILSKVQFTLHETYTNPVRVMKEPPYEVKETGYGSFQPIVELFFNYPGAKPVKYNYDLTIVLESGSHKEEEVVLELKGAPSSFISLLSQRGHLFGSEKKKKREIPTAPEINLFPPVKKIKQNSASSSPIDTPKSSKDKEKKNEDKIKEKEKDDQKKKEKDRERENEKEKKKKMKELKVKEEIMNSTPTSSQSAASTPSSSIPTKPVQAIRPTKTAPSKTDERKVPFDLDISSPSSVSTNSSLSPPTNSRISMSEIKRKIASLSNEEQIFKVASVLLSLPGSYLKPEKTSLAFDLDLATMDPNLVARLSQALTI